MRALGWFVLIVAGVAVAGSVLVWLVKFALGLVTSLAIVALVRWRSLPLPPRRGQQGTPPAAVSTGSSPART